MFQCIDATVQDIPVIQKIAEETWWPTYSSILPAEQLRYMLDKIYATEVLSEHMKKRTQKFLLLMEDTSPEGFAAYGPRPEDPRTFKLHKLYVRPQNHGKGFGKKLIDEVRARVLREGGKVLDLNVNRFNPAKMFYEKIGFTIIREED